jgi:hypothetical protein
MAMEMRWQNRAIVARPESAVIVIIVISLRNDLGSDTREQIMEAFRGAIKRRVASCPSPLSMSPLSAVDGLREEPSGQWFGYIHG